MSGFLHDPLVDIAEIKGILRDQYDPQSILKELAQNADDAGAQHLHLAWLPARADAAHPLLSSPALIVLNDGEFNETHATAIRCIRVGSKGKDPKAIGKFGLGLKSIFHLCEAFFYFASPEQPAACGAFFCQLLNPWSGSERHDDWDELQDALAVIHDSVRSWDHGLTRSFGLWIPLRREGHLRGKPPITPDSPEVDGIFHDHLHRQLPVYFPLLKSLESISVWDCQPDGKLDLRHHFELAAGARRTAGVQLPPGDVRPLSGTLVYELQGEQVRFEFGGREVTLIDDRLEQMKGDEKLWPSSVTIDPASGEFTIAPEKAEPHAAVILARTRAAGMCALAVTRAVFLPLASQIGSYKLKAEHDYYLLLHASYFLDAGRRDVIQENGNHSRFEAVWNQTLEEKGVLPLLPSVLDDFVCRYQVSDREAYHLTGALQECDELRNRLNSVCGKSQWVYRLGQRTGEWQLLPSDREIRTLPSPSFDLSLPYEVFPNLGEVATEVAITYAEWPRLSPNQLLGWGADLRLLSQLTPESVFGDAKRLRYFNRFLGQERETIGDGAWKLLVALARNALAQHPFDGLEKVKEPFTEFLRLLPPDHWLAVPHDLINDEAFLKEICRLETGCLLIPEQFAPQGGTGRLDLEDVNQYLGLLAGHMERKPSRKEAWAALALYLLDHTDADRAAKRARCGAYRLFRAHSYAQRKEEVLSWNDLEDLREGGWLFAGNVELAEPLQKSLGQGRVYRLVESRLHGALSILFEPGQIRNCDRRVCVEFLLRRPTLSGPAGRVELHKKLIPRPDSVSERDYRQAMRYLLHGRVEHTGSDLPLFAVNGDSDLWSKVIDRALEHSGETWRLVPDCLGNLLPPDLKSFLSIHLISRRAAESLLQQTGPGVLGGLELAPGEREEILQEISDANLWRLLPLHLTVDGSLVAIDGATFLEGQWPLGDGLADAVTLLSRPASERLAALYSSRVPLWDERAVILTALRQQAPDRYWRTILDALARLDPRAANDLTPHLQAVKWLPGRRGAKAPSDVIRINGLEDALSRVLSDPAAAGSFTDAGALDPDLRDHPEFQTVLEPLLPNRQESLNAFARCLDGKSKYFLGNLDELRQRPEQLGALLAAFDNKPPEGLHAYDMVREISGAVSDPSELAILLRPLLNPIPIPLLKSCLKSLADVARGKGADKQSGVEVFLWYLRALVKAPEFQISDLGGLFMRNQKGAWKEAEKLALQDRGQDEAFLLDARMAEVLVPVVVRVSNPRPAMRHAAPTSALNVKTDVAGGVEILRNYFRLWDGLLPREAAGAFFAMLGDHPPMLRLAEDFLGVRWRVPRVRESLEWVYAGYTMIGADPKIENLLRRQRFVFRTINPVKEQFLNVLNIFGEPIKVRAGARFNHLIAGEILCREAFDEDGKEFPLAEVTLREFDPSNYPSDRLAALLLETARLLLREIYRYTPSNLNDLFRHLTESDQTDLALAQRLLLKTSFFYFRQLNGLTSRRLRDLENRWEDLRYEEEDSKVSKRLSRPAIEQRQDSLLRELQELLEKDAAVQHDLIVAVRGKVEQYQYRPDSVPFELFQNADDAAIELVEMLGPEAPARLNCLTIIQSNETIIWIHRGRPINTFQRGDFAAERGRQRGFHRDLEKMLVLSSSDKPMHEKEVTGKFGLGFKSAFLISDRPRVLSGQLGFEVTAGLFPRRLTADDRERLCDRIRECGTPPSEGTAIELQCRNDISPGEVLSRFRQQAHVLLVFARKIKECVLIEEEGGRETLTWQETPFLDSTCVFAGELWPDRKKSSLALVIRGEDKDAILFEVGPRGFRKLDDALPTFWVTAPTSEYLNVGFAVNGAFGIDVGRAQLAHRPDDAAIASRIGRRLGEGLVELFEQGNDWPRLSRTLNLAGDVSPTEFWESLWKLMTARAVVGQNPGHDAASFIRWIVWDPGTGFARMLDEKQVLPTELFGRYRILTRMRDVNFIIDGSLGQSDLFSRVADFDEFSGRVHPGQAVSQGVALRLKDLGIFPERWQRLRVANVLRWLIQTSQEVPVQRAEQLGSVFSAQYFAHLDERENGKTEEREIQQEFKAFKFLAGDGKYYPAEDLLVSTLGDDEAKRATFAPPECQLNPFYRETALEFFKHCRQAMNAPADRLLGWGVKARAAEQRHAFLSYLLNGELAHALAQRLKEKMAGTWLEGLPTSALLERFEESEQMELLGKLGFRKEDIYAFPTPTTFTRPAPPEDALERLHSWWRVNRQEQAARHERDLFPNSDLVFAKLSPDYRGTADEREAWLTLFMRGAFETIGRAKPGAHLNFLHEIKNREWLLQIAEATPHSLHQAADLLENFLDKQTQWISHYPWIKEFLSVSLFSRWIDEYVKAILSINQVDGPINLEEVFRPRTNPHFDMGGPDAPPFLQALGIGVCLVIRELARKKILTNPNVYPYCYLPRRSMCDLVQTLGGPSVTEETAYRYQQSKLIYEFLAGRMGENKAMFLSDFDLPLQIVGGDEKLKRSIFFA
jgi:hypothetical protein